MKITLDSWTVDDFQSIGPNQTVELSPGLWAVRGENQDDGGSNGSGKSSLTRAIKVGTFGPKFCDVNVDELRNWNGKGKARIRLNYTVDGLSLAIDRTLGGKLKAWHDGKELEGTSEQVQEKINGILKLTPEQILYLTDKAQGSFGGFLLKKDKDKKEFLGSFFEMEKLESAAEEVSEDLKDKLSEAESTMSWIKQLRTKVAEIEPYISDVTSKIAERTSPEYTAQLVLTQTQIQELKSEKEAIKTGLEKAAADPSLLKKDCPTYDQMVQAAERLKSVAGSTGESMAAINARLTELTTKLNSKVEVPKEMTDSLAMIDQAISNFHQVMSNKASLSTRVTTATEAISKSRASIDAMKPDTCYTCGQSISSHIFEDLRSKAMGEHEKLVIAHQEAQAKLEELNKFCSGSEIAGLTSARDGAVKQIEEFNKSQDSSTLKAEAEELKAKLTNLNSLVDSAKRELSFHEQTVNTYANNALREARTRDAEIDKSLASLNLLVKEREGQVASLKASLTSLEAQRSKTVEEVNRSEKQHEELLAEINVLTKAAEVLSHNGFLGYIFDTILDELNANLNENLKSIPVAAKFSLYFTPDTVVKTTKSISKTISYKLFSGTQEVSFATLSGGEQLSVILSVDEALETVLSKRLGVSLSWKVFDEQFFWIDEHSKECILDFLRLKAQDKAYLIIDHAGEFNAAIDNRINVIKKNGIATVEICQ